MRPVRGILSDMSKTDYETDFYAWTAEQAALLRAGRLQEADLANIAEEIESLGRSDRRELGNRLRVLLTHLVKWNRQPEHRCRSWQATINNQRREIDAVLEDSPSLRASISEVIARAWTRVIDEVVEQTGLYRQALPPVCPWTPGQVLDVDFWPE